MGKTMKDYRKFIDEIETENRLRGLAMNPTPEERKRRERMRLRHQQGGFWRAVKGKGKSQRQGLGDG